VAPAFVSRGTADFGYAWQERPSWTEKPGGMKDRFPWLYCLLVPAGYFLSGRDVSVRDEGSPLQSPGRASPWVVCGRGSGGLGC
jgi:hypothetical protein